jgi:hypothetical protein
MGLLLEVFGGLAMDRSITAAVMEATWTGRGAGDIPWTWGLWARAKYMCLFNALRKTP